MTTDNDRSVERYNEAMAPFWGPYRDAIDDLALDEMAALEIPKEFWPPIKIKVVPPPPAPPTTKPRWRFL